MPITLSSDQFDSLIREMEVVVKNFGYGLYKGRVLSDNKGRNNMEICNCWEAIFIAGQKSGLGYTEKDIMSSRKTTVGGEHSLSAYVFRNRRLIMFPEPARTQGWGIPSGLAVKGDLIMWGTGKHVALFAGGELVIEFERGQRKGFAKLNELDKLYSTDIVMCAPLPQPGEIESITLNGSVSDVSLFEKKDQEILKFSFGLGGV